MTLFSGCSARRLIATPNVYVGADEAALYQDLAPELKSGEVDLLYVTDRIPETKDGELEYTYGRSPSIAFGSVIVAPCVMKDARSRWL